jgi:hypothetical protein
MKFCLAIVLLLWATLAMATPPCTLDLSNPAITRTVITLHTPIQGVTQYTDPSEWVYFTNQEQWQASTDTMMRHAHMEFCAPARGDMTGPITIPFRLRTFMEGGAMAWQLNGPMVRDVVFETATAPFLANVTGESVATGHLTLDPSIVFLDDNTNINHAAANGWTIFQIGYLYRQLNGDVLGPRGFVSMFTKRDPSILEQTQYGPLFGPYNDLQVNGEQGGQWGVSAVQSDAILPVYAPFNAFWPTPNTFGYGYAGTPSLLKGTLQIYWDRDLHHGIPGTPQARTDGIDPTGHAAGPHAVSYNWTTASGPGGVPEAGVFPNETLTTVFGFNVVVGEGGTIEPPPPPPALCTDPTATNVGGALPCVFPPPPPPPSWQFFTPFFQRLNDNLRVCDSADSKCVVIGTAVTP